MKPNRINGKKQRLKEREEWIKTFIIFMNTNLQFITNKNIRKEIENKKQKIRVAKYYADNKEWHNTYYKEYNSIQSNKNKGTIRKRKIRTEKIPDSDIAYLFGVNTSYLKKFPNLMEAKRLQILINKEVQLKN